MSLLANSSSVTFPATDTNQPVAHLRPPHLPFRRISLPSAPSMLHRQSVASVASFDSLAEDGNSSLGALPPPSRPRRSSSRPSSFEVSKKNNRRRPFNDAKEPKRRRIINEFHDTERSYVDGLELIYSHFLNPIVASLDTPHPLLDPTELASVFSNFIDIWNLHRSFFSSLSTHLQELLLTSIHDHPPLLSPILLSHFPYLSLYSPFVTSFHEALASFENLLSSKPDFASFIKRQEASPQCGKLKLRDWLLTIVQRCPRYLLLLKDLISCTDPEDSEHGQLLSVHALVSKITLSLNTSLHTHAQTLSLLAIQRSTPNLPFQLINPGRSLLKRGTLLQVEGSTPYDREFLLFSDCIMWLANAEKLSGDIFVEKRTPGANPNRPPMVRSRSKSEAELSQLNSQKSTSQVRSNIRTSPLKMKQRHASSGTEDRWLYKGHLELIDIDVVISPPLESGEANRLEILSPRISFAVYAENEKERDEWAEAVRSAKSSLFVSLNTTHPHSTLTSSASTQHLRRTLQALPHLPEDDEKEPKRGKVEHFVPAIWIPDGKTESCMRCSRLFGWRRRRHHCRLCGRCVCASCSAKTFFISDGANNANSHKPARACNACYDTVFPLMDNPPPESTMQTHSSTITTLSGFPSWKSVRLGSLSTSNSKSQNLQSPAPSVLMAIDINHPKSPKRELTRIEDFDGDEDQRNYSYGSSGASPRIRIKPASRPRSYTQIVEDFERSPSGSRLANTNELSASVASGEISASVSTSFDVALAESSDDVDSPASALSASARQPRALRFHTPTPPPSAFTNGNRSSSTPRRKEDTARRQKRFSLPALALQTTSVTARPNVLGEGKSKRFSLILGGKGSGPGGSSSSSLVGLGGSKAGQQEGEQGYGGGAAASKLQELLGRTQRAD